MCPTILFDQALNIYTYAHNARPDNYIHHPHEIERKLQVGLKAFPFAVKLSKRGCRFKQIVGSADHVVSLQVKYSICTCDFDSGILFICFFFSVEVC